MSLAPLLSSWSGLHRMFARLHGTKLPDTTAPEAATLDFESLYAAYAESTVQASIALRKHGKHSQEFVSADIASMRLFHRVKKMQGLKKAKTN